jgi:RNA polymerase sigma factor (sigma-70 family)
MSAFIDSESFRDLIRKWPDYALNLLYKEYYIRLLHIAERKTNNRKASEDIVQEAFIEVWKKSKWIADQKDLLIGAYLVGIVRHKAISFFHLTSRELNRSPDLLHEIMDSYASWESRIVQENTYARLRLIVAALPVRERECIQMKYFQEMSNEAIARELGISKKTVEKHITRGLKILRTQKPIMW